MSSSHKHDVQMHRHSVSTSSCVIRCHFAVQPWRYGRVDSTPSTNSPSVFGGAYCEEFLNEFFTCSFTKSFFLLRYTSFDKPHAPPPPPRSSIDFSFDHTTPPSRPCLDPPRMWMEPGLRPDKRNPHLPFMELHHSLKLSVQPPAPVKHETPQGPNTKTNIIKGDILYHQAVISRY